MSVSEYRNEYYLNFIASGKTVTNNGAMNCNTAIMGMDFTFLDKFVKNIVNSQSQIIYGMIYNSEGIVKIYSIDENLSIDMPPIRRDDKLTDSITINSLKLKNVSNHPLYKHNLFNIEIIDFTAPITITDNNVNWVLRLGFSIKELDEAVEKAWINFLKRMLFFVIFGAIWAIIFSRRITQPIIEIKEKALEITGGNLDQSVSLERNDEIGILAETFEQMRLSLISKINELDKKIKRSKNNS